MLDLNIPYGSIFPCLSLGGSMFHYSVFHASMFRFSIFRASVFRSPFLPSIKPLIFLKSSLSVEGGTDLLSVEIYNTGTGLWRPGFPLPHILRAGGYLPQGDDGDFVIIGGMQGSAEQVGRFLKNKYFL